jgi:hypothetical protein
MHFQWSKLIIYQGNQIRGIMPLLNIIYSTLDSKIVLWICENIESLLTDCLEDRICDLAWLQDFFHHYMIPKTLAEFVVIQSSFIFRSVAVKPCLGFSCIYHNR